MEIFLGLFISTTQKYHFGGDYILQYEQKETFLSFTNTHCVHTGRDGMASTQTSAEPAPRGHGDRVPGDVPSAGKTQLSLLCTRRSVCSLTCNI